MREDHPQELARRWAEKTATEQGLSTKVKDITVLRRVIILMGLDAGGTAGGGPK
jgi:hypothetical protein